MAFSIALFSNSGPGMSIPCSWSMPLGSFFLADIGHRLLATRAVVIRSVHIVHQIVATELKWSRCYLNEIKL